jgi:hypothetical protein
MSKYFTTLNIFSSFLTGALLVSPYAYLVPVFWAGLALTIVLLKRPAENYMLMTIFLYPLLPFHFGFDPGKPMPVIKLHRLLLISMFVVWFAKRGLSNIRHSVTIYPILRVNVLVISTLTCICLMNNAYFPAYNYLLSFAIESCLVAFIIFDMFRSETEQRRLLKVISLSGVVVAVSGIVERNVGFNWYSLIPSYREEIDYALEQFMRFNETRVRGAFTHAISYGATLALIMPYFVIFLFLTNKRSHKVFCLLSILLTFIGCYLSISRGPIIMFAFMLIFTLSFRAKKWITVAIAILSVLFLQPFVEISSIERVKGIFDVSRGSDTETSDSSYGRVLQFVSAEKFIAQRPLTGYGFKPFNNDLDKTIDNYYLRYILNFGLVGVLSLLVFITVILKKTIYVFKNGATLWQKYVSLVMLASTSGILILWLTVSLEEYLIYFWILTGMVMRIYVEQQAHREELYD